MRIKNSFILFMISATLFTFTPNISVGLPNPASVYCVNHGGTLELRTNDKGMYGVCIFPNHTECEEWAFFRGECGKNSEYNKQSPQDIINKYINTPISQKKEPTPINNDFIIIPSNNNTPKTNKQLNTSPLPLQNMLQTTKPTKLNTNNNQLTPNNKIQIPINNFLNSFPKNIYHYKAKCNSKQH